MQIAQANISYAPAIINVEGATKTERQLSVVYNASTQTRLALANATGKVGAAARTGVAKAGITQIAKAAADNNYRPAAEYFAARLGQPMVISGRHSFDALPDVFEAMVMKALMAKNGGYIIDKKTGAQKPTAAHALALELKAIAIEMIAEKEAFFAERKQARAAVAA